MTWAAIIQLIGGVRASVWAGLLAVALICLGQRSCSLAETRKTLSDERAAWAKQTLEQANAVIAAKDKAAKAQAEYTSASSRAEAEYQRGLQDGKAKADAVADSVRDGSLQLRPQWAGCETQRLSDGVAAAARSGTDGSAELRAKDSGDLVRVGSDSNAGTVRLQSELTATRALCNAVTQ